MWRPVSYFPLVSISAGQRDVEGSNWKRSMWNLVGRQKVVEDLLLLLFNAIGNKRRILTRELNIRVQV